MQFPRDITLSPVQFTVSRERRQMRCEGPLEYKLIGGQQHGIVASRFEKRETHAVY